MNQFSIVIVCRNEADIIGRVLQSVAGLSDDVLVYDNGSTDGTLAVLQQYGVRVHSGEWLGYGPTKKAAVNLARYDWVLSLDADEALDEELRSSLQQLSFAGEKTAYELRFKNLLGDKHLRWGEWGGDSHIRLFNRKVANWNEAMVHETLLLPEDAKLVRLPGTVLHRTMSDTVEYANKMVKYALLNAEKYKQQGKTAGVFKRFVSPVYTFFKHYVFQLGFLDGWEGLLSARMTAFYTFLKYARLHELHQREEKSAGRT